MYTRAVDEAAAQLRELRCDEWEDIGLACVALALAVPAAELYPALALPLFIGGLVIGGRGVRALWRRWDLVDRLSDDPDAYVISEVLAYALRATTMERRRTFAALIRERLQEPVDARVRPAARELEGLASELENVELVLKPSAAAACTRLLNDVVQDPLLDSALPQDSLACRVHQVRCGFIPRR